MSACLEAILTKCFGFLFFILIKRLTNLWSINIDYRGRKTGSAAQAVPNNGDKRYLRMKQTVFNLMCVRERSRRTRKQDRPHIIFFQELCARVCVCVCSFFLFQFFSSAQIWKHLLRSSLKFLYFLLMFGKNWFTKLALVEK